MHLTAFRSRRANAVVGWLAACPSLLNWHFYTAFHLAHHRHTQDPERDPELASPPPSTLDAYVWRVLALPYWRTRLQVARAGLRGDLSAYPFITDRAAPRIIRSIRLMCAVMLAGSVLSTLLVGWWAPLVFWIGPQLLGQPFLRALPARRAHALHHGRQRSDQHAHDADQRLIRLLMWNMPFHTEHHLYPSIPFHRLPDAHAAMRARSACCSAATPAGMWASCGPCAHDGSADGGRTCFALPVTSVRPSRDSARWPRRRTQSNEPSRFSRLRPLRRARRHGWDAWPRRA